MINRIPPKIHKGDKTHHQLQLMNPVSFRPINKIASIPGNDNPVPFVSFDIVKRV